MFNLERASFLIDRWVYDGHKAEYLILGKNVFAELVNYFSLDGDVFIYRSPDLNKQDFGTLYGVPILLVGKDDVIEVVVRAKWER